MLAALEKNMAQLQTNSNLQEAILHYIDNAMAARNTNTHRPFQAALKAQGKLTGLTCFKDTGQMNGRTHMNAYKRSLKGKHTNKRTIHVGVYDPIMNKDRHSRDKESRDNGCRKVMHHT
jgi:hypothetical protein